MKLDIIFKLPTRSADAVSRLIQNFGGDFEPTADEYEFPQYAEAPEFTTNDVSMLIQTLEHRVAEDYSIYWRATSSRALISNVFVGFTEDQALVGGITFLEQNLEFAQQQVSKFYGEDFIVGIELYPPTTIVEFTKMLEQAG